MKMLILKQSVKSFLKTFYAKGKLLHLKEKNGKPSYSKQNNTCGPSGSRQYKKQMESQNVFVKTDYGSRSQKIVGSRPMGAKRVKHSALAGNLGNKGHKNVRPHF